MTESNSLRTLAQVRRQVVQLCAKERFAAAQMYLAGSGCPPERYPGLWEYLARRSRVAKADAIAHNVRQVMWNARVLSADLALREAEHFLEKGDFRNATFVIESTFGQDPHDRETRHLLARCYQMQAEAETGRSRLRTNRDIALRMDTGFEATTPEESATIVDLLRFSGALERATERNEEARARFPDDPRFHLRLARIHEQMRNPEAAIAIWRQVADAGGSNRIEALFKLYALNEQLDRQDQMDRIAAELALVPLSLPDRVQMAIQIGQPLIITSLAQFAARGGPSGTRLSHTEGTRICDSLLNNGDLGLVVWLRRQRVPVSDAARNVLESCGFGQNGHRDLPDTLAEANALRSPDFMLPLSKFLNQHPKPVGWPGTRGNINKVLLINGTLGGGGAERQFVELVRALIANGMPPETIETGFFNLDPDRGFSRFLPDLEKLGVTIHDMHTRRIINSNLPSGASTVIEALPFDLRDDARALWHLLNEVRPDALHGWQDRAGLACAIAGTLCAVERVIMSARNMSPVGRADRRLSAFRALYQDFVDTPNFALTANSLAGAADYAQWLDRPLAKVRLLRNAIDTEKFQPRTNAGKRDPHAPIRIGGVFRLVANKRPLLWLETVAALRRDHGINLQPKLFGTGPLRDALLAAAQGLGVEDLTIESGETRAEALYGDIDMMLLTSRVEGTPNVVIEAQACGLPVAACDVGGVSDALHQRGETAGLLLAADVSAADAAARIAAWHVAALDSPIGPRVSFARRLFGADVLAREATALYTGNPDTKA